MTVLKTVLHIGVTRKGRPDYRVDTNAIAEMDSEQMEAFLATILVAVEHVNEIWSSHRGNGRGD